MTVVSSANLLMLVFWEATQSYVKSVCRRGLSTQPWGTPVLTVLVLDVRLLTLTDWGLSVKSSAPNYNLVSLMLRSFSESLRGMTMLNAELYSINSNLT